jgi:hypothetical protein
MCVCVCMCLSESSRIRPRVCSRVQPVDPYEACAEPEAIASPYPPSREPAFSMEINEASCVCCLPVEGLLGPMGPSGPDEEPRVWALRTKGRTVTAHADTLCGKYGTLYLVDVTLYSVRTE